MTKDRLANVWDKTDAVHLEGFILSFYELVCTSI